MNLVIVSGAEATCKTAIGKSASKILGYPYRSKDTIKEALFDSAPRSTWDYAWYEKQAKDKFFDIIQTAISRGESIIIESNFNGSDKLRLKKCIVIES